VRGPGVPALTDDQVAALDLVDELANSPEFVLNMRFRVGDIQFLNNYCVLHARTDYEDWPEPERKRDLLRLWLVARDPLDLPDDFARGGITSREAAFG
jgi:alpha-ketoglutarate-dependent taurine dioxygenase